MIYVSFHLEIGWHARDIVFDNFCKDAEKMI